MQACNQLFLASALSLLLAPLVHAQSAIATLTCQPGSGPAFTAAAYSFQVDLSSSFGSASLNVDPALIPTLVPISPFVNYSQCTLTNGSATITLSNVSLTGSALGYAEGVISAGSQFYTGLELLFGQLSSSGLPSGYARSPVGSISCAPVSGTGFTASVLSFDLGGSSGLDVDIAALPSLVAAVMAGTSYTCTFTSGGAVVTVTGGTVTDAGVLGYGASVNSSSDELYASFNFNFVSESVSGTASYNGVSTTGTLSCTGPSGASLSVPVYSFGISQAVSVVAAYADFSTLKAAAQAGTVYSSCTITSGAAPVSLANVSLETPTVGGYVGPSATAVQLYADLTLDYGSLTVNSRTIRPGVVRAASAAARPKPTFLHMRPIASGATGSSGTPLAAR